MSGFYTAGLTSATTAPAAGLLPVDTQFASGVAPQTEAVPVAYLDAMAPTAIPYAATITPDRSTAKVFTCTLTGNVILANPTNLQPGQAIDVVLTQDGTGSRLLSSVGSLWKFPGGTKTLSTGANAVDRIAGVYDGTRICATLSLALA